MRKLFFSISRLIIIPPILYIINELLYNEFYYWTFSNVIVQNVLNLLFILFGLLLAIIPIFFIIQLFLSHSLHLSSHYRMSNYVDTHPGLRFLNLYKHQTIRIIRKRNGSSNPKSVFPFFSFKVLFFGGFGLILEGDFLLGVIVLLMEIKIGFLFQLVFSLFYNYEHLFYLLRTDYEPIEDMDIFIAQRLRLIPRQNNYKTIRARILSQLNTRVPLIEKWEAPEINIDNAYDLFDPDELNNRVEIGYYKPEKSIWPNTYQYSREPFNFIYDHVRYRCIVDSIPFDSPQEMWDFLVDDCVSILRAEELMPKQATNAMFKKALFIYKEEGYDYLYSKKDVARNAAEARKRIRYASVIMRAIERKYDVSTW